MIDQAVGDVKIPAGPLDLRGGSQDVRRLPFDRDTFSRISQRLFIHGSIARVISRADVPIFSRAQVEMGPLDSYGRRQQAFGKHVTSPVHSYGIPRS